MQTLDSKLYDDLDKVARKRGITVQQLLRAVIVPDWFKDETAPAPRRTAGQRSRRTRRRTQRLERRIHA